MKKFFIEKSLNIGDIATISSDEFFHLSKVVRCQVAEQITLLCGDEFTYLAEIQKIEKTFAECKILNKQFCLANPKINITIFQGLPKGDRLELIIQKVSELGATTLIPFESDFTIAKNNPLKKDRIEKISKEACKQCGRSIPLKIENTIKFSEIPLLINNYNLVLFLYENAPTLNQLNNIYEEIKSAKNIAIIIGSEGGFSTYENETLSQLPIKQISLGKRILRTETATIALTGYLSFLTNN